ncbi:hypothetical protein ABH930_001726 [Kitasatospora sp. GAS204A]|uniref:hypothetical protein n=1 Tax=unclassified Kitasatospora TaxID=2633591 RepID=UPI0024766341|nr:hypothetical protein [Kitasatospora sp. GAS204B]MDH6117289.1 hypothetical protein [Kitasatospora sp. GAS204B]
MLRHVSAPTRDFTRIRNSQIWDDDLSDSAFRLAVRGQALTETKAARTTVTELADGLTGGRVTAARARKNLAHAGLLHHTRWRGRSGQIRSESLLCDEPMSEKDAERLFAAHFAQLERLERLDQSDDEPDAGGREDGEAEAPSPGTVLPEEERLGEDETSPLPVPPPTEERAKAERVLLALRRSDPRLVLGGSEVRRLAPLAAEWLARGVSSESLRHVLTAGLPGELKSAYALLHHRLVHKIPDAPERSAVVALVNCDGCERPFRPVSGEAACGECRQAAAAAASARSGPGPVRMGWRERVASVTATT